MDLSESPGVGVCDRCQLKRPLGWFGAFWLCDECTLRAVDAIGVNACGRAIQRMIQLMKQERERGERTRNAA